MCIRDSPIIRFYGLLVIVTFGCRALLVTGTFAIRDRYLRYYSIHGGGWWWMVVAIIVFLRLTILLVVHRPPNSKDSQ